MTLPFSTRLALRQLAHKGAGLIGVFSGVCLAVVLVFAQLGFQNALIDSVLNLGRAMRADLIITSAQFETMAYTPPWFSRNLLDMASGIDGVTSARPVYAFIGQVRDQASGRPLAARFIAFDPAQPVLDLPDVDAQLSTLSLPNAALVDRRSRQGLYALFEQFRDHGLQSIYTQNAADTLATRIDVRGSFSLGPDFTIPDDFVVSDLSYYRLFRFPLDRISLGLVTLNKNVDPNVARFRLQDAIGDNVRVFTKQEFLTNERNYFLYKTPIGIVFSSGFAVGLIIGTTFIFNTLQNIISSNLPEYAVLRAMGYRGSFFVALAANIAIIVSIIAFLLAIFCAFALYRLVASATKLHFALTPGVVMMVFMAVLVMSISAVVLSIRKIQGGNPLDLF